MFQSLIKNKYFLCAVFVVMCNGMSLCSHQETDADLLFEAIQEDRNQEVCTMINANNRLIFSSDEDGHTPLHLAVIYKNIELTQLLLDKNAPVNFDAPASNMRELLENKPDSDGRTPLHYACMLGRIAAAKLLVGRNANVNAQDDEGYTPLHYAARRGHQDLVEFLVAQGANVDARDKDNSTPLHDAAMFGHGSVISFLAREEKGDVKAKAIGDMTPLHLAVAWSRDLTIIELLIDLGADVNAQTKEDEMSAPLNIAMLVENIKLAKGLIRRGADVNAQNDHGETALHLAAAKGSLAFVRLLIENGANIDAITEGKKIAIAVCQFAEVGGSVQKMFTGKTPLHYAAERGYLAIVKFLVEQGAQVDAVNLYNDTALMLAQKNGCDSVVAYLNGLQGK